MKLIAKLLAGTTLAWLLTLAVAVAEDVIILKDGTVLRGRASRVNHEITLTSKDGKKRQFTEDQIRKLYKGDALLQEYRERKAGIREGDAQDHLDLGRWCFEVQLRSQALVHLQQAAVSTDAKVLREVLTLAVAEQEGDLAEAVVKHVVDARIEDPAFRGAPEKLKLLAKLAAALTRLEDAAAANDKDSGDSRESRASPAGADPAAEEVSTEVATVCQDCHGQGRLSAAGGAKPPAAPPPGAGGTEAGAPYPECKTCQGRGVVMLPCKVTVKHTPLELQVRREWGQIATSRRDAFGRELAARSGQLKAVRAALRAALFDPNAPVPEVDKLLFAVPVLGAETDLLKTLEQAKSAADYRQLTELALGKGQLDVAARAAVAGQKVAADEPLFKRAAPLENALYRVAATLTAAAAALDRQVSHLRRLGIAAASHEWMLKNPGHAYAQPETVDCPVCKGKGSIRKPGAPPPPPPAGNRPPAGKKAEPEKAKPKDSDGDKGKDLLECPRCAGEGTVAIATPLKPAKIQEASEALGKELSVEQDYLLTLTAYNQGLQGMVTAICKHLATGEGALPKIKRSWLNLPKRGREGGDTEKDAEKE